MCEVGPCKHVYHSNCINKIFDYVHPTCPMCRIRIKKRNLRATMHYYLPKNQPVNISTPPEHINRPLIPVNMSASKLNTKSTTVIISVKIILTIMECGSLPLDTNFFVFL